MVGEIHVLFTIRCDYHIKSEKYFALCNVPNFCFSSVNFTILISGFDLWFKTKSTNGLLLFSATAGQEELVALQLKSSRPWFIFDPQGNEIAHVTWCQFYARFCLTN